MPAFPAHYLEIIGRGAAVESEPTDQAYGIREFAVQDINGVTVVFGQDTTETIHDMSVGRWIGSQSNRMLARR